MAVAAEWFGIDSRKRETRVMGEWIPQITKFRSTRSNGAAPPHRLTGSPATSSEAQQPEPVIDSMHLPWLVRAIDLGPATYDVNHLSDVVAHIDSQLLAQQFSLLSNAVQLIPVSDISPQVLVTMLRVMGPAKAAIPNWTKIVSAIQSHLTGRGVDTTRALRGLL